MSMHASRKLVSFIVIAAACVAVLPAAASATVFNQDVCNDPSLTPADMGFFYRDDSPFELSAACPDLKMSMWRAATRGERVGHAMLVRSDLTKVTARLSGGPTSSSSGISVRLRVCSFDECGRALTAGAAGAALQGTLTLIDGIPSNPATLLIEAECTRAAGCSVQPVTVIRDLTLSYDVIDNDAPVITLADPWGVPYSETTPTPIAPYDYVYFNPEDVVNQWWTVDDGPSFNTDCSTLPEDADPVNCGFLGMIRPPVFEGIKKLTVYVQDAAGNVGHASALLSRDSTAPGAPQDLKVGDGDGWINTYEFSAGWTNPDSDVTGARFTIREKDGRVVRNGVVDGAGVSSLQSLVSAPGSYTLSVWLFDASGNEGEPSSVDFSFDWIPPVAPPIDSIPVVNASFISSGFAIKWQDATYWGGIFSNVCNYRTAINSLPKYEPVTGPDVTTVPFSPSPSITISPAELAQMSDGVRYFHVAGTSCAGVDGPASNAAIVIDRKAPTVSSEPASGGWLKPGKPLVLRAEDADPGNAYAGVSSITYSLDGGPDQLASGPKATVPISQGMHSVKFHAEDIAGNESPVTTITAGVDALAPTAAFGAIDPADPALVRATVSDPDSGVGDAWLEYRPPGSPNWARLIGSSAGESPRELSARFPDDDSLPSGEYLLRIVAADRAGNSNTTTKRVDGAEASLTLPLRRRASLTFAVAPAAKAKTSSSLTVPFGSPVVARGTLRDADGAPLSGAQVAITESVSGGKRAEIAAVTTDAAGEFSSIVPPGPSRVLVANFRGDSFRGSANASATFNVRGSVSLKKPRRIVRSGKRFYLRGKVNPGLTSLPKSGAQVVLQHRSGKRWSGLVVQRRTTSNGSFEFPLRQLTGGREIEMEFRVAVMPEEGWPYATGYSNTRVVILR